MTDGYAQWYANRLWMLLPAVYRSLDVGPTPTAPGPLREIVNRIGAQAAVVRRSIDRMGENQSIETCDDWVIPYIGDLVATRIVSCLDAAAQRIDVAKTIYYRRRAGTVGLLEELAADIASTDARVVEFFRRLGRTRHQFDPPLSYTIENALTGPLGFTGDKLEIDEGLFGRYSKTPAGGFADLRNAYAAGKTGSAFDEYAYTADLRNPGEAEGWYNIRNLGVFLWWLGAWPILAATPVPNSATNPTCFTFDPTGRNIPLFAPSQRAANPGTSWGENWKSPDEWMLPVEISELLWKLAPKKLYGDAFQVALSAAGISSQYDRTKLRIYPQVGRFSFIGGVPVGTIVTNYTFGLLMPVGAGGFDQSILSALAEPAPGAPLLTGGIAIGNGLNTALANAATNPAILFGDSLTYVGPTQQLNVPDGATVLFGTANPGGVGDLQRPVLRWVPSSPTSPKPAWTIASEKVTAETTLILQGLLLQGADVVLTGNFDAVFLRMVTMDPGTVFSDTESNGPDFFASAIDGLALSPGTLWIEGIVTQLTVERSFTGPIRTRNGGTLEQLLVTDSVIQSIPTHPVGGGAKITAQTVLFDATSLAGDLANETSALAKNTVTASAPLQAALVGYVPGTVPSSTLTLAMQAAIVGIPVVQAEQAWPLALADLALGFSDGAVSLSRTTILGPTYTHRLAASESILDSLAMVENPQAGCVRFTAYAKGSRLHQPFRSVVIPNLAAIFVSKNFGQPEYARLRADADLQILPQSGGSSCGANEPAVVPTILKGAQNGSEMGVYCLAKLPLKHQGLAFKFEEYAPVGQLPVWIDVD
jgi:hypothetical protein